MKIFLPCLFLAFLFSCNSSKSHGDILSEEKMTHVLQEVMLLENYYQTKHGSPGVYKEALDSSVEMLFKKLEINEKQFSKSFDFYAQNPELFKKIQAKILENLNSKYL